jgi:excisionase family DNA binding protein
MAKKSAGPVIQPRNLNVKQAAAYLGATIWFIRQLAWKKEVATVRYGHRLLFPIEELDAYNKRQVRV